MLERELAGLDAAVYQLQAVGRNLNQVTRALHLGALKDGQLNVALIELLEQAVERLAKRVSELAEKSRLRRVFRH